MPAKVVIAKNSLPNIHCTYDNYMEELNKCAAFWKRVIQSWKYNIFIDTKPSTMVKETVTHNGCSFFLFSQQSALVLDLASDSFAAEK